MELDDLKERWRKETGAEQHSVLDAGWIDARISAINRQIRRRLRREAAIYLPMILVPPVLLLSQGFNGTRLVLVAVLSVAVSAIAGTLWYSERRLTAPALDGTVREALNDLRGRVERAARAYAIAYLGFIAFAIVAIAASAWRQTESVLWMTLVIPAAALVILWARRSGQTYVNRMFGPYLAELSDCVEELEKP
jgi:peptidoglycan/LPS O-acetylase OafA/YrhL